MASFKHKTVVETVYSRQYSIRKFSEGGPCKRDLMNELKILGFTVSSLYSVYMGHTGILVRTNDLRKLRFADRVIFGR
jgi:hypothetical protein